MTVDELNSLEVGKAAKWFEQCCASTKWVNSMVDARPYANINAVKIQAKEAWATCGREDVLAAFKAHPMIGNVESLRKKFENTKAIAAGEQSGVSKASEDTLHDLKNGNIEYLNKHGFIFIICATGLSAEIMLGELNKRLPNNTNEEIRIAAEEQLKITLLRLSKALDETRA